MKVFTKVTIFILFLIVIIIPPRVHAGDVLSRMLNADTVKQYREDQDAIVIGELTDKKDGVFTIKVHKVISGKVKEEVISIKDFGYGWGTAIDMVPKVSDFAVMSIKKDGGFYKKAWGIFKATSSDYKTLKLITKQIRYSYGESDVAAVEWYVNSGGKQREFFFHGEEAYVRRANGEEIKIYPKSLEALNSIENSKEKSPNEAAKTKSPALLNIGIAALFILPIAYWRFKK